MAPSSSPLARRLVILYASQTGNAIDVAERVGREAERGGCPAVDVLSMDSFNPSCLPGEMYAVFVVSTMGQGDPPDPMKDFWKYLRKKHLGAQWLEGLHYAVFGLGDSSYIESYKKAWEMIKIILDPKMLIERSRLMSPALKCHNEGEPQFMLQMVTNQCLTKGNSDRDVRHFELEDRCSPISYQVGGVLEILPSQNPSAIDNFIKRCKLDPECYITDGDLARIYARKWENPYWLPGADALDSWTNQKQTD